MDVANINNLQPLNHISLCLKKQILIREILSQSTPLIPEIEKAFDAGKLNNQFPFSCLNKEEYISNLKLDI